MNSHVSQESVQNIPLQQLDEDRSGDHVPESNKLLQPPIVKPNKKTATLKSCSEIVFWKCRLWMVITSIFLLLIFVTILTLTLPSVSYIDEDEYWDPESIASGNHHNFSGILKVHCGNSALLLSDSTYNLISENLQKRLTDVYRDSPALGRYFVSAEVIAISDGNNTASYHLWFLAPQDETEEFMKYRMSQKFVMNILRQNIYDQEEMYGLDVPGCTSLTLDPTSLSLTQIQLVTTEG